MEKLKIAISNLEKSNKFSTSPIRKKILKTMNHIAEKNKKIDGNSFYLQEIKSSINGWALQNETSEPKKNQSETTKESLLKLSEKIKIEYKGVQLFTASNMKAAILISKNTK